jgi:hypothetical protein
MVFKIVVGAPRYQARLKLFEIGERAVRKHFQREFTEAYQRALATAR